jgi:hypothetical protein
VKLVYCYRCDDALRLSRTDVLQAWHCCTASLQALQARAAANSTSGGLLLSAADECWVVDGNGETKHSSRC